MVQALKSKSFRWVKVLGILTLIGVLIAVARIVIRVFREERLDHRVGQDSDSGV